jgi:hypothetical protein
VRNVPLDNPAISDLPILGLHMTSLCSGGNLGGGDRPPTFVENDEFSEILTYKRAKNSLFKCKWGGGLSEI